MLEVVTRGCDDRREHIERREGGTQATGRVLRRLLVKAEQQHVNVLYDVGRVDLVVIRIVLIAALDSADEAMKGGAINVEGVEYVPSL